MSPCHVFHMTATILTALPLSFLGWLGPQPSPTKSNNCFHPTHKPAARSALSSSFASTVAPRFVSPHTPSAAATVTKNLTPIQLKRLPINPLAHSRSSATLLIIFSYLWTLLPNCSLPICSVVTSTMQPASTILLIISFIFSLHPHVCVFTLTCYQPGNLFRFTRGMNYPFSSPLHLPTYSLSKKDLSSLVEVGVKPSSHCTCYCIEVLRKGYGEKELKTQSSHIITAWDMHVLSLQPWFLCSTSMWYVLVLPKNER